MEEAVMKQCDVAEAAVVGIRDKLRGSVPFALVVLKNNSKDDIELIKTEIIQIVREFIGPVAYFHKISFINKLPKTKSGKVLRSIIRKILSNEAY